MKERLASTIVNSNYCFCFSAWWGCDEHANARHNPLDGQA